MADRMLEDDPLVVLTREEVVLIVAALDEFRDTGERELAERVNLALRGWGDEFVLTTRRMYERGGVDG